MGVAALGMMMGQLQEANKDDYNTGAMLRQVMGTTQEGQQGQAGVMNSGVGATIANMVGGQSPQAQTQQNNGGGGGQGTGISLGSIIQQMLGGGANGQQQEATSAASSPQAAQPRKQPSYDNSGSNTNWSY